MTTCEERHAFAASSGSFAEATVRAVVRMVAAARRRIEIARCERRLHEMPDHMLKDLGLHRSEIAAVTRLGRAGYRH